MVSRIRFKVGDLVYCSYWSWYKREYGQDPIAFVIRVADYKADNYDLIFSDPSVRPVDPLLGAANDACSIHKSYLRHVKNEEQNEKTKND